MDPDQDDERLDAGARPVRALGSRLQAALGALAVLIAVGAAFLLARHQATGPDASPAPSQASSTDATTPLAITEATQFCATQNGSTLQVGLQITNDAADPLVLSALRLIAVDGVPTARAASTWVGPCDQFPSTPALDGYRLDGHTSTWLTMTIHGIQGCLGNVTVQLQLDFTRDSGPYTVPLNSFAGGPGPCGLGGPLGRP